MGSIPSFITKDYLHNSYVVKGKSVLSISKDVGKSIRQVSNYLKKFQIPTRPFSTRGLQTRLGAKLSEETKDKIRQKHLGKTIPIEVRKKMGSKGKRNPGYIDGRTPRHKRIRHSIEYKLWREAVFTRDNWTCVWCGQRGGNLNADHIKAFALYPALRFAIDNGRTLCIPCHKMTDTFGNKSKKNN